MDESKKKYKDYIEEYIKDQNLHKEEKQKIDEETSKIQVFLIIF